jgi:hypothetical protein
MLRIVLAMVPSDGSRRVKPSVYFRPIARPDLEQAGDGQIDPRHDKPPGVDRQGGCLGGKLLLDGSGLGSAYTGICPKDQSISL